MPVSAILSLAKTVGKQVIPSNTVVGKAIGSNYSGKGIDLKSLLPPDSKSAKIVEKINNTGNAIGQIINPNASASAVATQTKGGMSSLLSSPSSIQKLDNAYGNDLIAKTALGQGNGYTMTGTVPKGALDGQLVAISDKPDGVDVSGKVSINPWLIIGAVGLFLVIK